MAATFDSEIRAKELRSILLGHLSKLTDDYIRRCSALDACSSFDAAALQFSKIIPDIIADLPLAIYGKDNPIPKYISYVRMFTGEYYEKVSLILIQDVIYQDWLFDHCKLNPKYYKKLRDESNYGIIKALRFRILKPSLMVMCFKNGVVDLRDVGIKRTDELLNPFSPDYHCVKQYDFKWNPKAECPLWRGFLGMPAYVGQPIADIDGVLPEASKRAVLQKFLGSGFIDRSRVKFEYMLILYGTGANGKSVIKEVLDGIFGADEVYPNLNLLDMAKDDDHGMRARKAVEGFRFSYCTELSPRALSRPETVKVFASGEGMSGRALGENISIISEIPLFMCNSNYDWSNYNLIPKDSPDDESMARRVLLLNFDKKIEESRRDSELVEKLLKEKEGIFMWIVRGYKRLRKSKWKIHDSLLGRIDKVRMAANHPVLVNGNEVHGSIIEYIRFKNISPIYDEDHTHDLLMSSTELHDNYVKFCEKNGIANIQTRAKLSRDFETMGYSKKVAFGANRRNGFIVYWSEPHPVLIFNNSVPSIEKILDVDSLLGEQYEEEEFIND